MLHSLRLLTSLVLAPVLNQISAQAAGVTERPTRFVFVVESNGLPPEQIQPAGMEKRKKTHEREKLEETSLTGKKLPYALEPLKRWQDRLLLLQGLSSRVCPGGHSNNFTALGCFPGRRESQDIRGATIDAELGKALPSLFPHLGLGISKSVANSVIYNISASGPGKPLPTQCHPDKAYTGLFGSVAQGAGKQDFHLKTNLLDFLSDDIKRVEARVAGAGKEQLGSYLNSFESMRDRQSRLNEITDTLRKHAPVTNDKYTSEVETDRLDAMFDIGTAALVSGLTNVLTLSSAAGNRDFDIRFSGLGIRIGKHGIGHGGGDEGKTWFELSNIIRRFHFDLIARLAKKLESIPEGDGTMLDNTLIIYMSDAAESHHSRCWEWPFVIMGNPGGKLRTNRHFEWPYWGKPGHRTVANLYTTFLHLAGQQRDRFGFEDPNLLDFDQSGPLSEIMA